MAEVTINLSDYKASGVYFLEVDNSIVTSTNLQRAHRLAVGFNPNGPFNRPIFLSSSDDCDKLLGDINRKLERKGCFLNRNVRTMIKKSPVFAINLLCADTKDTEDNTDLVGVCGLSFDITKPNIPSRELFAKMFNRRRFWIADENELVNAVVESKDPSTGEKRYNGKLRAPLFSIGNCGTKDISVIVRKAENVNGYNVTFKDWYGSEDKIPYSWISPSDYVSDYFIQVVAISGNWDDNNYKNMASDAVWKEFFTEDGLKKEKFAKFLRLEAVDVVGNWTGCVLPNFYDNQGKMQSIDYKINTTSNSTGLLFGINEDALEAICIGEKSEGKYGYFVDINGDGQYSGNVGDDENEDPDFIPDFVGNMMCDVSVGSYDFLSYHVSGDDIQNSIQMCSATLNTVVSNSDVSDSSVLTIPTEFVVTGSGDNIPNINVGDYVKNVNGLMTKVIKKRTVKNVESDNTTYTCIYTAATPVAIDGGEVEVHRSYSDIYSTLKFIPLTGLKLTYKHLPGYDAYGNVNYEAGVEKIYRMLEEPGIRRGLLNKNVLTYRYIIDTMAYGLGNECRAKKYLCDLAAEKMRTTALCNIPSMSQFASSDAPFFGDFYDAKDESRSVFDISYLKDGGNLDMGYPIDCEFFTLPTEENGSKYCGFFTPFLKYNEGSRSILVPPAADVSNTFMNKFSGGDPYKTVANLNGIINNSEIGGVEYDFDDDERGVLENMGINPIINDNGTIMIYGDRTAYQDVNSDLNFLHTRELLNTIEIECGNVLKDYVFTYNNAATRSEIAQRINPILSPMLESGALAKYDLQIDENNNPKEVIDEKFAFVDIGVWITQNMEKIICRVTVNRSTTA